MRWLPCLLVFVVSPLARADVDEEDLGNCEERAYDANDPTPLRVVTYSRDAQGHATKVTTSLSGGTTLVDEYTYDTQGRKVAARVGSFSGKYEYDDAGRLCRIVDYDGKSSKPNDTWEYSYDSGGRLTHVTQTVASSVAIDKVYTYDKAGRLATAVIDKDTTETYHYGTNDKPDRMTEVTHGKTRTYAWKYDAKGRPIERSVGDVKIVYLYDCKGR